ncbi:MAG: 50S ribosomal protein L6 [Candidatus Dormibacteraeota bacterium]|uniref:Large ribosomal subunit protein uL6 n=1 Tax=Candidatus Aeolococcus gillhamiae TaxID=3127015 RepID=A0A2W6A6W7_9BACT|nr:50S ribosomal protein L6 [Candidatus Dormibacteraeota bacterium]PZR81108.1 MAG: 50S ribosomal protein L6 [Candidatus Dormibacter sp. RRmetagenome_bin12]
MSRIGKMPITVPGGVEVTLAGSHITVTGSRGTLERSLPPSMIIEVNGGVISVRRPTETTTHRSLHGLTRTLVANMVEGVSQGFTRQLDLVGVGFRAAKQGSDLVLSLGYSHPIRYTPPDGVTIDVPAPTQITVSGTNKEIVGQVAAKIRSFRKPEPYKGKGVMYRGEVVRRKAGKSGKAGKGK